MKRNLKALGLVVMAMFAMTALSASAASAAEFHSDAESTTVKGSNTDIHHFKTSVFDVTCETATFEGTQTGKTASSITITPKYSGCHVIILFTFAATVNFNSCDYNFNSSGTVEIKCTKAGDVIEINSAGCNIKVGPQTIEKGASYSTNTEGAKKRVAVKATAEKIKYSQTGSSCSTKEGSDAVYTGSAITSGTSGGSAVNIWYE